MAAKRKKKYKLGTRLACSSWTAITFDGKFVTIERYGGFTSGQSNKGIKRIPLRSIAGLRFHRQSWGHYLTIEQTGDATPDKDFDKHFNSVGVPPWKSSGSEIIGMTNLEELSALVEAIEEAM